MVELLRETGELVGEPRPITHPVKFYEQRRPPARDRDQPPVVHPQRRPRRRPRHLSGARAGADWHPDFMRHRYESWVAGLTGDWLISRQQQFGVPFPVWYPVTADGTVDHDRPIVPAEDALPIDPSADARRATPRPSAGSRAGSWATPT